MLPHGEHLSESWDSDSHSEEWDSDVSESMESVEAFLERRSFERIQMLTKQVQSLKSELENTTERLRFYKTRAFSESIGDVNMFQPDFDENSPLRKGDKKAKEILEKNQDADEATKWSTTQRWLGAVVAFIGVGGIAFGIYELMLRLAKGEGDADIDLPQEVKDLIRKLYEDLQRQPDEEFWKRLAAAVDAGLVINGEKERFTVADQLVFLNFTIETNHLQDIFDWTAQEMEENAEAIKAYYDASHLNSDIYKNVINVKFKDAVLPRAVAASQLKLVLGWIASEIDANTDG